MDSNTPEKTFEQLRISGENLSSATASAVSVNNTVASSLVSQHVDKETIESIFNSQSQSLKMAQVIAALQPATAKKQQQQATLENSMNQQAAPQDTVTTSLLFKQLFDFVENVMDKNGASVTIPTSGNQPAGSNTMQDSTSSAQGSIAMETSSRDEILKKPSRQTVISLDKSVLAKKTPNTPDDSQVTAMANNGTTLAKPRTVSYQVSSRKEVKRTIIINMPNGQKVRHPQVHVFMRLGDKDAKTGNVVWQGWDQTKATLPEYHVDDLTGYTSHPQTIPAVIVTPDSDDTTVQVSFELQHEALPEVQPEEPAPAKPKKDEVISIDAQELRHALQEDDTADGQDQQSAKEQQASVEQLSSWEIFVLAFATLLGLA